MQRIVIHAMDWYIQAAAGDTAPHTAILDTLHSTSALTFPQMKTPGLNTVEPKGQLLEGTKGVTILDTQ
jgi:hypothetical protein